MPELLLSNYLSTSSPTISAPVSTTHKFALGMLDTVFFALRQGYRIDAVCTPEHLYRFADEHRRFIGRTEVCPASPRLMREVLAELIGTLSAPIAPLADASHPAGTYFAAIRVAKVQWILHRFALLFDIARLRTWHQLQSHTVSSEMQPDVRHASAYAAEAQSTALLDAPLDSPFVRAMLDLDWRVGDADALDEAFARFTMAAEHVIRATAWSIPTSLHGDWAVILHAALSLLQEAEHQLGTLLALPADPPRYTYVRRDLDHFFGKAHPALQCTTSSL
ncbi:hypothetical protein [Trinickia fusca]|nr:hypothetical protein [Trinickia fusca]